MRYPKGSIQLSASRDVPLLRQILRSEFVTDSQLFEFIRLNNSERSRNSFHWRMRRLVARGLVLRHAAVPGTGEAVYSLAIGAATMLQAAGEYCLIGGGRIHSEKTDRNIMHAIALNEIQIRALRAGLLVRWIGSPEIRSQNELTLFGFAKDYDAVVTVRTDIGERRFALEYERTLKSAKCYRAIAACINREVHLNRVLYLVANYDILRYVSGFFTGAKFPVFFGLVADWHSHLLEMQVLNPVARRVLSLRQALDGVTQRVEAMKIPGSCPLPFE